MQSCFINISSGSAGGSAVVIYIKRTKIAKRININNMNNSNSNNSNSNNSNNNINKNNNSNSHSNNIIIE